MELRIRRVVDGMLLFIMRVAPRGSTHLKVRKVDIVVERDDGLIAGVEIKAWATVRSGDFGGLRTLAQTCGKRFAYGIVLYDGTDVVPLSPLWR